MGFIKEFRDFAVKGNVFDMAVGIIVGAAFGKVAGSFVADIMMPPIGFLAGNVDFSEFKFVMKPAQAATETAKAANEVAIYYGKFITAGIDFVLVAFAVFMLIKLITNLKKKEAAAPPPPPPGPTKEQLLLTEIRDLLAKR